MYNFDFVKPATIADAVAALQAEEAQALGGGQTLIPTLRQRLARPSVLVSLTGIAELKGISREGDALVIGAGTTHGVIAAEAGGDYPALASLAARIGDPAVRNRGTIGGSLANNDPAACYPAALLASGGTVVTNSREIAAEDYFQGMFTTALEEGEIITRVRLPIPQAANYQKFAQPASRFPLVGVFVARHGSGTRVAVTGASEGGVFRWHEAEETLSQDFTATALDGLTHPRDGLMGDLHGTPAYRAHLIAVLTKRAVQAAA